MVSVVNGYVCFSSCDEAKAKQGKDPHPTDNQNSANPTQKSAFDGQPASILDGALKDRANAASSVGPADKVSVPATNRPSVDILA